MSPPVIGCLVLCVACGVLLVLGAIVGYVGRSARRRNERARKKAWK